MGWTGREGKSIIQVGRRHKAEGRKKESKLRLLSAYSILPSEFWLLGHLPFYASNASCLSLQASKVEKLCPSHLSLADHIDPIDPGGMEKENPLNADPIRDLSHGERRSNPSFFLANDHSLEGLYSFLLSLHDLDMDPYGISHSEIREICPQLFSLN